MTEQEAKTKWCPFARAVMSATEGGFSAGAPVYNRVSGGVPSDARCIGSACMAWREQMRSETIKGDTRAEDHIAHHVEGFCGLAGKP